MFSINETTLKINTIKTTNCIFEGNFSYFRFKGTLTTNPDELEYGLNSFIFNNNIIKNTYKDFIWLIDIPYKIVEIQYNEIINFTSIFANLGTSNEHEYTNELTKAKENVIIKYNHVYCEPDCWNDTSGYYYCFVLVEGYKCEYAHNIVEGLKSEVETALYDAYLSTDYVFYYNNIWKNNIVFVNTCLTNSMLKSKHGCEKKEYKNNIFILEESFLNDCSKTIDDINLKLYDNVDSGGFIIDNNIIKSPKLMCQTSTSTGDIVFTNNTIEVGQWINSALAFPQNQNVTISNNNITIKNGNFYLVKSAYDLTYTIPKLIVKDNILNLNTENYLILNVVANNTIFSGNLINIESDLNTSLFNFCNFGNLIGTNNILKSKNNVGIFPSMYKDSDLDFDIERQSNNNNTNTSDNIDFSQYKNNAINSEITFVIDCEVIYNNNKYSGTIIFKIYNENNKNYIEFNNGSILKSAMFTDENRNAEIKFSDDIPLLLKFYNTNDSCFFYSKTTNNCKHKLKLSIKTL